MARVTSPLEPARLAPEALLIIARVGLEFAASGGPAYIADANGHLLWTSQRWQELMNRLGRLTQEMQGEIPWSVAELEAAARQSPGPVERDDVIAGLAQDEMVRSIHWLAFDPDGRRLGLAGTIDETPVAVRLKRQVAALQERFDDIVRLVSDWLWEVGPDLTLTMVSPRVIEALGLQPRQLLGRKLLEIGNFIDKVGREVRGPLNAVRPRPFRDEAFIVKVPEGTRQCRLSGLPMFDEATGRFRGFRGTARDVTVETAALSEAARSRAELGQALEAISEGFVLYDADERLLLWNSKSVELMPKTGAWLKPGLTHTDILRLAIELGELKPGLAASSLLATSLAAAARAQESRELELADGRWLRASDRFTGDGRIVGIRTDITELKQRERALLDAKELAEAANRAKSEFLANISHELRTPLNAIIGFSELMLSEALGPLGNAQYREYVGDVLGSGRHLLGVINDIIDLAKVEAGRLDLNEDVTAIEELVAISLRLVGARAARGNLRLVSTLPANLPPVLADSRKIRQILLNLLSNAVKFTPAGGLIEVSAGIDPAGDLGISVRDTGIGIAAADIPTCFKPFGQVDAQLTRRYDGAGLGLPLSRAMAELHGGTLDLTSTVGQGTIVTLTLPARRLVDPSAPLSGFEGLASGP